MLGQFINLRTIKEDISAGLVLGIESVPDGLAQGVLAAVNPVYGLYGYMMGTFSAAFFTSSVYMCVQATGGMSLVVASVPQVRYGETADVSLFTLAVLTGVVMLAVGLFRLGSLVRFVPNAVMVGFVNAIAVLIILGQLSSLTGYSAGGESKVLQAINLLLHVDKIDNPSLLIGLLTIALILTLERTSLKALGLVVAMVIASLLVAVFRLESVALVRDIAEIPKSLPHPVLPSLALAPPLIIPAFSLAFVGLVQGAAISRNFVNPDGRYPDASAELAGQGIANIACGLFQGMPVGGSMSATALVTTAGARSRFANIFAGIIIAVSILLFGTAVGYVAMPAMAALLMVVGFRTLKIGQAEMVGKTGPVQLVVMVLTFVACLFIPLQYAVIFGIALSVLLYVVQQSNKITVKAWDYRPGQLPREYEPPETVPPDEITVLVPYGSLFFATAPLVEKQISKVAPDTRRAVVILYLHGQYDVGSTFLGVLERYAARLKERSSKLVLAAVPSETEDQLNQSGVAYKIGRQNIFVQTDIVGEALLQAYDEAVKWMDEQPSHQTEDTKDVHQT